MKFRLTHAMHDPAHCLAPGLFRSVRPGERRTTKLHVVYEFNDAERIEFCGPEPLGADDLRVLQGLVAMAGARGALLPSEPKTPAGEQLRLLLEPRWAAAGDDALVVRCSYRSLAAEIGYSAIDSPKVIRNCVERLWKVSIILSVDKKRFGYRMLSEYASDDAGGRLCVALNPRITCAVLGLKRHESGIARGGQRFVRIRLDEVRALRSDVARLLHQRLCGWIDQGRSPRPIHADTLCGYVWPDEVRVGEVLDGLDAAALRERCRQVETRKKRRQRMRAGLAEIAGLGWRIDATGDMFLIARPPAVQTICPGAPE